MNDTPFVSIVMCTYNGEKYIDEQIRSIIEQDYKNFELVIVDDASTDSTFQKLQAFQKNHSFIRLYKNEGNIGYNKNFEKALSLAKGELISLADQDDIWLPSKTTKLVKALHDPSVTLAHVMTLSFKDNEFKYNYRKLHKHYDGNDVKKFFFFNHVMGHDAMFRRNLLPKILPIPDKLMYDWWIVVNAVVMGKIRSVPEVLVYHRMHETNSFFNKKADARKKELDLSETLDAFTKIGGMDKESLRFLNAFNALVKEQSQDEVSFNNKMFWFFLKHREKFFGHKRRLLPFFNHVKNSVKYAKFNFKDRGISF